MRLASLAVPICAVLLPSLALAAPSKPAPAAPSKAASGQAQAGYARRVATISDTMKPMFADLWVAYGKMEDLADDMAKSAKKTGDASASDKQEWDKQKSALATAAQNIRVNTKRLRALSPVPRLLKTIDAHLVDSSLEIELGLEALLRWTNTPSNEQKMLAERQVRKGVNSWYSTLVKLGRATDPAVKAKVFVED